MYLPSDEDPMPKGPSKKNKKRWCGGHEGREHDPFITLANNRGGFSCGFSTFNNNYYLCWHQVSCRKCHKVLEWKVKNNDCPEYLAHWREWTRQRYNIRFSNRA